jgi:hypothetical protein
MLRKFPIKMSFNQSARVSVDKKESIKQPDRLDRDMDKLEGGWGFGGEHRPLDMDRILYILHSRAS